MPSSKTKFKMGITKFITETIILIAIILQSNKVCVNIITVIKLYDCNYFTIIRVELLKQVMMTDYHYKPNK